MFGTPAYMAPEAIEFAPTIDGRADVYGFGVLFFEALTGKLPFIGPPGLDLLRRILTEEPPMVTLYRSDLPSDVANLIARALAKDPNDRFRGMVHLIQATEDRLLPLLPTPSSATPISDVLLLPPSEWNPSASIPVVGAVFDKEPLRRANHRETRALYSVAGEPLYATNQAGLASGRKLSLTSTGDRTRRKRVSARNARRFLDQRGAIGAAIVILVLGAAWVGIPSSSNDRGLGKGQISDTPETAATVPRSMAPLPPSRPISAPSPTVTAETVDAVTIATAPLLRMAASHPSRHGSRRMSATSKPRAAASPDQPSAPRAGRLTLSDF
jgi:hypothetical protein